VLGVLGVLFVLLWWGCRDREERGVVARLQWTHTTELQRWHDTNAGAWAPGPRPGGGPRREAVAGELAGVRVSPVATRSTRTTSATPAAPSPIRTSESYSCGSKQVCSNTQQRQRQLSRAAVAARARPAVAASRRPAPSTARARSIANGATSSRRCGPRSAARRPRARATTTCDTPRSRPAATSSASSSAGRYWVSFAWGRRRGAARRRGRSRRLRRLAARRSGDAAGRAPRAAWSASPSAALSGPGRHPRRRLASRPEAFIARDRARRSSALLRSRHVSRVASPPGTSREVLSPRPRSRDARRRTAA
jgi:hypothetical protein